MRKSVDRADAQRERVCVGAYVCVRVGARPGSSQNYKVESSDCERLWHISINCPWPGGELVGDSCPGRGDDLKEQRSKDQKEGRREKRSSY